MLLGCGGIAMENIMGFDGYLYYVIAFDDDGSECVYEYGNIKHAIEHLLCEKNAIIVRILISQNYS